MELVLTDGKVLEELAREDKTLWEKIRDWVMEIIGQIRRSFESLSGASKTAKVLAETMETFDEIERLFTEGAKEAGERAKAAGVETTERTDIGKVYSQNDTYDFTKPFHQQVEDYKNGNFPKEDALIIGATPKVMLDIGFNALPMTINQTHIDYALNGTKNQDHHIGEALLAQLQSALEKPIAIVVSESEKETSVVIILSLTHNGSQINVPVFVDGSAKQNGVYIHSNAVKSVYARENAISKMLNDALEEEGKGKIGLFYWDKNRAIALLSRKKVMMPNVVNTLSDGSVHSIRESGSPVKPKFENVTESQQFKRWFGDWEKHPNTASKVVNADGTPKIVYHQTGADFTVFNTDNPAAGKYDSETPNGIFFKDNDHDIGLTGKKQMAVYLSIRKPLRFSNREEANRWYKTNIKGYSKIHDEYDKAMKAFDPRFKEIEKEQFDPKTTDERYDELDRMEESLIEEMKVVEDRYRAKLRALLDDYFIGGKSGYDGIELAYDGHRWVNGKRENVHTYIVFDRNQIKSATDNIGTFDGTNPDIRYSLGEAENADVSENRDLTDRELLGMALEGAVQNEDEWKIVKSYREQASMLETVREKRDGYAKEANALERQIKALRARMEDEGDPYGWIRKAMDEAIGKEKVKAARSMKTIDRAAKAIYFNISSSVASSMTVTPSSLALVSLEPAASPATT